MFRVISKLNVQRCLANQRLAQFISVKKYPTYTAEQCQKVDNYYRESDRYIMFRTNSELFYQFDDETKNIVPVSIDGGHIECYNDNYKQILAFQKTLTESQGNDIALSDSRFDKSIDDLCQKIERFTLNEVILALQMFAKYPLNVNKIRQRNGVELFYAFDQACSTRSSHLLASQMLFICSIWLSIPCSKTSQFSTMASRILNRKMKSMNASEVAQAFLYINCWAKPFEDIRSFENVFENVLDDMTIEECATTLWTFIRFDMKIEKQELRKKYFEYLAKKDLNRLAYSELSKVLTITSQLITSKIAESEQWTTVVQNLRKSLSAQSLKKCILIANVGTPVRAFDDEINWYLFNRCLNNRHELLNVQISDLEYISRILSLTNYHEEIETIRKIGYLVLDEMKNRIHTVVNRQIFATYVNVIRNLTLIDVYDFELMDNLLNPKHLRSIFRKSKQIDLQMYEIDGYCRINLKDIYNGNHLPDAYMRKLCFLITWVPDRMKRYKKSDEHSYIIEDIVNKVFIYSQYAHAIPYRKHADLFVCLDKNTLKTMDISERYPPLYEGRFIEARSLTKDDPNLIILAFVIGHTKEFLNGDRNKCEYIPIGYMTQKIKQLKLLGFHPITVVPHSLKGIDQQKAMESFILHETHKVLKEVDKMNGNVD